MRRLVVALTLLSLGSSMPATAHHVGTFIPKDDDITKNVKDIKAATAAGRFDLAVRLFDDGIVHGTMEKQEKRLPRGLEDGLRAALRRGNLPGVDLRLAIFLAFLTDERLADTLARLAAAEVPAERQRDQARKLINAAWRYYNLADFVVSAHDAPTGVALRMGFEDAQTFLGGMMVDPMWAAAAKRNPVPPDEARAARVVSSMRETLRRFVAAAAAVAASGGARNFLPGR